MVNSVFTVILSTKNRRDLVPRAINSVLNQTFLDFEFIIINNGSKDDTAFIINQIKDKRIKYIDNPNPTTSCDGPRNMGIKLAKGKYIAFIDDDDIWYPKRLEKVKEAFENNPDAGVVCHYENRRFNGRIDMVHEHGPWSDDFFEVLLYEKNCLSPPATTIKTEVLRKFNGFDIRDEFGAVSDYDLWLRMAKENIKVFYLTDVLGEFGLSDLNLTVVDPGCAVGVLNIIKHHMTAYEGKPDKELSYRGMYRLLNLYCVIVSSYFRKRDITNTLFYLYKTFELILIRPSMLFNLFVKIKNKFT